VNNLPVILETEVTVTPQQLASLFWSMDSTEQIHFFNSLAEYASRLDFEMQLQYVINPGDHTSIRLTNDAQLLLETIRDNVK
jgi:hypothetical protein